MTEPETKDEVEIESEDFTDELSDEALDREGIGVRVVQFSCTGIGGCSSSTG